MMLYTIYIYTILLFLLRVAISFYSAVCPYSTSLWESSTFVCLFVVFVCTGNTVQVDVSLFVCVQNLTNSLSMGETNFSRDQIFIYLFLV